MDDAGCGMSSRPPKEHVHLYNSTVGYESDEVRQLHQQRRSPPCSVTSPPIRPFGHSPPSKPYTDDDDDDDEKGLKRSSTASEADWSTEEDEREYGMGKEAARSTSRYRSSMPRRPLINHVRNDWRTDARYEQTTSSPPPDYDTFDCRQILCAKRVRRIAGLVLIASVAFWIAWCSWLSPRMNEQSLLKASLDNSMNSKSGWFGANVRPNFQDMIQLKTLDESLLPAGSTHRDGRKRLIIVGDIHGCEDEFRALLAKLSFHPATDHLILAGDFIAKGPASAAVISLALSLNASCVRGNHEDRVLLAHRDLHTHHRLAAPTPPPGPSTPHPSQPSDTDDAPAFPHGAAIDAALAASLSPAQIAYLAACPVILRVGTLPALGALTVVHAGLVPGVALERQDPSAVMSMRSIDLGTHVPSRDARAGVPWTKLWNAYQGLRPRGERATVVYGHDSRRGLVLERWSKGLDTGCVKGGRLTALVVEGGWRGWGVRTRAVGVGCRDYRERRLVGLGEG